LFRRSVLVVEDEDFLRSLLASTLETAGFSVSTASNALDAKQLIKTLDPDALIVDIHLGPGPNGFDIAVAARKLTPEVALVFLTNLPDPRFAGEDPGSIPKNVAYLNKNLLEDNQTLIDALESALIDNKRSVYRHDLLEDRPFANLSRTQVQILQLMAQGLSNQQIAEARMRSLAATESAITRTFEALGIHNGADGNARVEAVSKYLSIMNAH
jgi:DNA-binding NarL/FixJ family response regulator